MQKFSIAYILLILLLGSNYLHAANWTIDGDRVYWAANGYEISAYPAFSQGISHIQYVNFSSNNPTPFTGNFSFVFSEPITWGAADVWDYVNHPYQEPIYGRAQGVITLYGVVSYAPANLTSCDFGDLQNAYKYLVNTTNQTNIKACFDAFSQNGNNYTLTYSYDGIIGYQTKDNWYYDWRDISSLFRETRFGNYQVWTVNNVQFTQGTKYQVRFRYGTRIGTSGKYDIYVHAGSPQDVVNGIAPVYLHLDPWWNSSYAFRAFINCSNVDTGTPIVINGSSGFTIDGQKQIVWTTCQPDLYLYWNNYTDYVVANNTTQVPMYVKTGNRTSFDQYQVWTYYNAIVGYDGTLNGTSTAVSLTGKFNGTLGSGASQSSIAMFGNRSFYFDNSLNGYIAVPSGVLSGVTNLTMVAWLRPVTLGIGDRVFGFTATTSNYGVDTNINMAETPKQLEAFHDTGSAQIAKLYTDAITTNVWHFVFSRFSNTRGTILLGFNTTSNSTAAGAYTYTPSQSSGAYNYIGRTARSGETDRQFNGQIDFIIFYNASVPDTFFNQTYYNAIGTAGYGTLGETEIYFVVYSLSPTNATITSNNTINFTYSVNSSQAMPVNVLLYLDGVLIANNTTTTNATLTNSYSTTYGQHSWYVFAYNSSNISYNTTSASRTFEVQFNVTAVGPANNTILQGNTAILYYSTQNLYPINCTTYLDGRSVDYRILDSSSSNSVQVNASAGPHTWYISCVAGDNPNYTRNSSLLTFTMDYTTYNNTLNLTTTTENVLASPQAMFFDADGSLNVLYFTDDGTSYTMRIKTITNNSVTCAANATLQPTSTFMLALREINQTVLLSFNASDSTKVMLANFSSCTLAVGTSSFPYSTARTNSNYDPYTYAQTKHYSTLNLTDSSYYLFAVPLPNGTGLFRKNISSNNIVQVGAQFPSNYAPAWQTIANSSNLSGWYYLEPNSSGAIRLGYYDGNTRTVLKTLDSQAYSVGKINQSIGIFERYEDKTYVMLANLDKTTIYLIEDDRNLTINENISQPSHFFFIDKYTFLFFNTAGSNTSAYSCYFANTANCTKYTANEYGISMPYERGRMATAKRDGLSDVVAKGRITSTGVVTLLYNLNTYDAKYRCFNETNDVRKTFTVQIYTNTTANILKNSSWGYVIPSASLGPGLKKSFFICEGHPQRMFLSGLTNNFTINAYSLENGLGVYYTIKITDEFGQPVEGAKVSAYRFSPLFSAFVVIEQGITDSTGNTVLYLQPFVLYRLTIEQAGYVTMNFDFTPTAVTSVDIRLSSAKSPLKLPNFYYLWEDISYSLTPTTSFSTNETNISFQISSNSSSLEYFGLEVISLLPNGTKTTVYSNNISGQPSGGIITYPITTQGSYLINPYFKHKNFSEHVPFSKTFKYQNETMGFIKARELFIETQPIAGWVFYLIAVVCAMLAVGFASKYVGDGAGLAGLAVLWGFSLFNPSVEIVCAAGINGACITPIIATTFATVATIAALYAKQFL